ncbi:GNAT family N-acetyltransferase [Mesorhizobium sp. 8]|nr:GNAT family N-acetyltransferase [Mesorhizobium sp. 8]
MISVMPARSARDFDAAADLCRRLGQWDAEAVAPHGVSAAAVTAIFHPDRSGSDLAAKYDHPDAMMFLARVEGVPAGCVAFEAFNEQASEIEKFFVDTQFRGKGIGRSLMAAAMAELDKGRRRTVLLHTTFYMTNAIAMYEAFGFTPCPRFRQTPEFIRHTDVFMARTLSPH